MGEEPVDPTLEVPPDEESWYWKEIKMAKFYPVLKKLSLAGFSFFAVTFAVYYFNLDMKLTAAMEPVLEYFYDKVDRDQHL